MVNTQLKPFAERNLDLPIRKYLQTIINQKSVGYMRLFKDLMELASLTTNEIIWIEARRDCENHAAWLQERIEVAQETNSAL